MAHPPSESANGRTNPASSRNLKPPALAGGVFTKHSEMHPEWAAEAWRISKVNGNAGKGAYLHKMTETFCLKGLHAMTGANVRIDPSRGRRACLACRNFARDNPPRMTPEAVVKVTAALEGGATISQIIHGRPAGGGKPDRSLRIVDAPILARYRRNNPEFDRFVAEAVANNNSVGQRIRYAREKARTRIQASRDQLNDYHKVRAMLPANFPGRDYVVSDIFEAMLDGSLRREDVKARIQTYITAHNRTYPTKFAKFGDARLVSLDEVMFDDGSTTRGDTVSRGLWD
jgi:hypothetical protein